MAALDIKGSIGLFPGGSLGRRLVPPKGNTYNVLSTAGSNRYSLPITTTLSTYRQDTVNVGNKGSVKDIKGTLVVDGVGQATYLSIDGSRDGTPPLRGGKIVGLSKVAHAFVPVKPVPILVPIIIDANQISGLAPADILFNGDGLSGLKVNTPQGGKLIDVLGTPNHGPTGSVHTALISHGNDAVSVEDASGRLDAIQGALDVSNPSDHSTLTVDSSSDPTGRRVTVAPGLIRGFAPADITYAKNAVTAVGLHGGTGGNTFQIQGTTARTPVTIDGGSGRNTLVGPNLANTWEITAHDAGKVGNVTFTRVGSLTGGSRADTFKLSNGAGLSGGIDGGFGVNTLDMSAQDRNVVINLSLGTATSVGGSVVNIANATGGKRNSILVGDGKANSLQGGTGKSLLIGGGGSDTLTGGKGDNILIGGITSYDLQTVALEALMNEFARADEDFFTRLSHLLSGDGANGDSLLNSTTVHTDEETNLLSGGPEYNWFFVSDGQDTIKPGSLRPGDVVTKL